jgi:hypothetical protein
VNIEPVIGARKKAVQIVDSVAILNIAEDAVVRSEHPDIAVDAPKF